MPPKKQVPTPVLILGVGILALVLFGGLVFWRMSQGEPSQPTAPATQVAGPQEEEQPSNGMPQTTLTPRTGTPPEIQSAKVGERKQIEGLYGKGTVMVVAAEWSEQGDLPPGDGKKYLNLDLRYDTSEGSLFVGPNNFAAYDANFAKDPTKREEYYVGIGSGKMPQFDAKEIKTNEQGRGWVSIEMPPGDVVVVISDESINPLVMVSVPKP